MRELADALRGISGVILDMDGVIYLGDKPIEGSAEAVAFLRRSGKKIIFLTNNSESSRASYVRKLARMGIPARMEEIVTSGQVAADYIRRKDPKAKVYVIGGDGLRWEIKRAGLSLVAPERAVYLIVGLDRKINYSKIDAGLRALLSGAKFIATNIDHVYPTERGISPGAGSIIGALKGCSRRSPDVIMGKPYPRIIRFGLRILGTKASETAIIGDRLDMDVRVAKRTGLMSILVLSGLHKPSDVSRVMGTGDAPDFVIDSLAGVID